MRFNSTWPDDLSNSGEPPGIAVQAPVEERPHASAKVRARIPELRQTTLTDGHNLGHRNSALESAQWRCHAFSCMFVHL
jgi:hypothetical protein